MANRSDITPDLCRKLLRYDPETGKLYWLERQGLTGSATVWNARYAGKEAFTCVIPQGYLIGRIFNMVFKAHRVVWAVHHGEWPKGVVDHINGEGADNRLCNIRDVPNEINLRNARRRSDNSSGMAGVYWNEKNKRWLAGARVGKSEYLHLGSFETKEGAVAARAEFNSSHGFTPRHGLESA